MKQKDLHANAKKPWSSVDELNWAADGSVFCGLKKRGEEPCEWLSTESRQPNTRRKAVAMEQMR